MTLLSVCHSIRKVAVRIVYGENILDLVLREDALPFLEDLTPMARGSIEKISLNIKLCQYSPRRASQAGKCVSIYWEASEESSIPRRDCV